MWRPPNWEIDKLIRTAPQLCDAKGNIYNAEANKLIFEAGADAILEALKVSGIRMENYHPSNRTVIETAAFLNQCKDGILIFIPEESK